MEQNEYKIKTYVYHSESFIVKMDLPLLAAVQQRFPEGCGGTAVPRKAGE